MSCASKKDVAKSENIVEINPKLIFLNYTLTEEVNGAKTIDFISETVTDGKARNRSNKYIKIGRIGDLKCSQLDNKSEILKSIFIKNPLNKSNEFVNDSLQLESKASKLKKVSFSLRLQLHPNTKKIVISEIIDSLQNVNPLYINKLETK